MRWNLPLQRPKKPLYSTVYSSCLAAIFILSCESEDKPALGTCRLYNNWNDETYEVRTNVTLDECQDAARALPSNNSYWSAFDWNEN